MGKLTVRHTAEEYNDPFNVERYSQIVDGVGLWNSERIVTARYASLDSRILDIGCGAGRVSFGLYRLGYRNITGIDIAENMIRACKAKAQDEKAEITFLVADACSLPFDDDSFDYCIFSMNGLMTVPSRALREQVCKQVNRVLKPGHFFVVNACVRDSATAVWERIRREWESGAADKGLEFGDVYKATEEAPSGVFGYGHMPDRAEVDDTIGSAGFSIEECFLRSQLTEESDAVQAVSNDVTFWICRK